jgi:hypothetical protein
MMLPASNMKNLPLGSGCPDWANFCLLGDCLLWAVVGKLKKRRTFLDYIFHGTSYVSIDFNKKLVGLQIGLLFSQTHLVTLTGVDV